MDRRTQKTKKAIRDAFLTLLSEKNINKITVAEISQLADLGRGTFYLHYKDIYDLYEKIEDDFYSEIEQFFDQSYSDDQSADLMYLTHMITDFMASNKDVFLLLSGSESNGRVLRQLKELIIKKTIWKESGQNSSDYLAVKFVFVISGVVGVLEEWLLNGIELSQEQISQTLYAVLHKLE